MKKRVLILLGVLVVLAVGGAGGWYYYQNYYSPPGAVVYVTSLGELLGSSGGGAGRYAGVVEPQETLKVNIESGRVVKEVDVEPGQEVKEGEVLFNYDLSSIQQSLKETQLELDRLKNEAMSLNNQINTLEKERRKASRDSQLDYQIQIETNRMNLQKNSYDQKTREAQIEKLNEAVNNTEVRSEIDGIIQKIDTSQLAGAEDDMTDVGMDVYGTNEETAFITILSTGAYRIKGRVKDVDMGLIVPGTPVIIRSRVDEDQIWRGLMGMVDMEADQESENNYVYAYGGSDSGQATTYPFYVELESSEGLMLGQHVYIEMDNGQEEQKKGIWLMDGYVADADTPDPYVWAEDEHGRLEKRTVLLGEHDDETGEYQILEGLSKKDSIAFPSEDLQEGTATTHNPEEAVSPDSEGDMEEEMPMGDEDMMMEGSDEVLESVDGSFVDTYPEEGEILEGETDEAGPVEGEIIEDIPDDTSGDGMIDEVIPAMEAVP